jgi:hypothetical protein
LHAKQTMPEAQVAGVHSQIAKIELADKGQLRGRWDANDRVLVHVLLDGQSTLDEVHLDVTKSRRPRFARR